MSQNTCAAVAAMVCVGLLALSSAAYPAEEWPGSKKKECIAKFHINPTGTDNTGWTAPTAGSCKVQEKDGHFFPDPTCTPGALNPTVNADILANPEFSTECVRNMGTTEEAKKVIFGWYGLHEDSTCEMDHFVSLEIGGSDMLMNLWPECGPPGSTGMARDFKQKDSVELFLGEQVKLGEAKGGMSQAKARELVTKDWTALIPDAAKAETHTKGSPKEKK